MTSVASFVAHRRESDGTIQDLWDHLRGVSAKCAQFAHKIDLADIGELLGLLHDVGKATSTFDAYIRSATGLLNPDEDGFVDSREQKGKIDHSSAGAQWMYMNSSVAGVEGTLLKQIAALCVASHHSGLIDCLSPDGEDVFLKRMHKSEIDYTGAIGNLDRDILKRLEAILSRNPSTSLSKKLIQLKDESDDRNTAAFKFGLLTRFLLSCLLDADRLDTGDFEFPERANLRRPGSSVNWATLVERLERHILSLPIRNKVDEIRKAVSNRCREIAAAPRGYYRLTVPTGGGKTLASLRFALHHATIHRLERIVYVIPYTSIIDQNATLVKSILEQPGEEDNIVLEHHSNLTPERETGRQNLLSENWDAPVVFTTSVQLLETLFGGGTKSARRMHQLANAVLIFDEVQTLPVPCLHLFNTALRFLVHSCGASAVLCTATQPPLDEVRPSSRGIHSSSIQEIIPDVEELFHELHRVNVVDKRKAGGWDIQDIRELALMCQQESKSVLAVVNTKREARELFSSLRVDSAEILFHLSTGMCPAHRLSMLRDVRERLDRKMPVLCVSTQLIEAGIDVDFGCVIRALAGLDSVAQAAGRCNRNGMGKEPGKVFVVNVKDEKLTRLREIRLGSEKAERVLDEFRDDPSRYGNDLLSPTAMREFYRYYFHERMDEMSYPVAADSLIGREDTLFELLSLNQLSLREYQRATGKLPSMMLRQSFHSAGDTFQAIESYTKGVVVPFGDEGRKLIDKLLKPSAFGEKKLLLRQAQRYSVNVFSHEMERLLGMSALYQSRPELGVFILHEGYYNSEFGIDIDSTKFSNPLIA